MPHSLKDNEEESMFNDYGHRLLPQIIDHEAKRMPDKLAAAIPKSSDVSKGFREVSYKEMANAVNHMSWWLEEKFGGRGHFEPIAYLGVQDHRYTIFEMACIKTGYVALLPSHRNSSAHFQSLFEATKLDRLLFSEKYTKLAASLQTGRPSLTSFQIPEFEDMVQSKSKPYAYTKTWAEAKNDPIMIIHTSGSTGAPKPITYTNAFYGVMEHTARLPPHDGVPYSGLADFGPSNGAQTRLFNGFPLFHLAGLFNNIGAIFFDAIFILGSPDVPVTAKQVVDVIKYGRVQFASLPPSISNDIVKMYSAEFEECLPTLEKILTGGGPLATEAGQYLWNKVQILQLIGSTECGAIPTLRTDREDWEYFYFHPAAGGLVMEPREDGLSELVIKRMPGQEETQAVFQVFPDLQEWRTKDLYRKHPTKPYHVFVGRLDDVIVLANGEKFNPVGMENTINGHPMVKGSVVVGMRRNQVALVVEKADNAPSSDEEFLDAIWPAIQNANKDAPGHGQLFRKMIIVAKPEKPFPRAGKGTVIRPRAVKEYESEINELYNSLEEKSEAANDTAPVAGMPVMKLPVESIQQFVQDHVAHLLEGDKVSATQDFFVLGFDSLQTSELTNNLRAGLKPFMQPAQLNEINVRVIYENPTPEKLGTAIYEIINTSPSDGPKVQEAGTSQKTLASMKHLIEKYTTNLPERAPITFKQSDKDLHVVLTGSTGYLGQYLLLNLLKDPKVSKVICFNRSGGAEAKYLAKGGVKEDLPRLEFLQVSFGEPNFGLPTAKYQELVNRVDAVIHNAWKVDFLHTVETYEDVHIRGVANFVNWAITAPRNVALSFISSVATCANWTALHPGEAVPEAVNEDCKIPGMGYGQSKFVGENILNIAARERGISATVLRSGQIAGPVGEEHGIWNKGEWFPSLMQTSKALGLVPATLGSGNVVDWIPVDVQASIIVDAIHSAVKNGPTDHARAYNMVNPEHVLYTSLLKAIEQGLGGPKPVSLQDWVDALKKHDATSREELEKFPGLKLVDFYESMIPEEGMFSTPYVHDELKRESKTMANIKPVNDEAMSAWLRQWNF